MKLFFYRFRLALFCALWPVWASAARADIARQDLGGAWTVHQDGKTEEISAQVPGSVFLDLLRARKILDPFFGDNEKRVQWVGQSGWIYRRAFAVSPPLLKRQFVRLRCEGLDTLATVRLNGRVLGQTDNMFRRWEWDVKPFLKPGVNTLEISFASTFPYIEAHQKEPLIAKIGGLPGGGEGFVRKAPYHYGWDWGPRLVDCGIWKPISLLAYDEARIDDVGVVQDHSKAGVVGLSVETSSDSKSTALRAEVVVSLRGKTIAQGVQTLRGGRATSAFSIRSPQLWWPNGLGAHPLYDVRVRLLDGKNQTLDESAKRIGLRTFQLLPATNERPIQLAVNGVPFFAKGANWIPADSFAARVSSAKLRRYVADAAATNMNILRLWGGGYYEEDALFDACDEAGIAVWLDFKFANHAYPFYDPHFRANVRMEVADQAKRLRHHASIAVWCGNNELTLGIVGDSWDSGHMSRTDYNAMFGGLIPDELRRWAPDATYTPGSPEVGDEHYWGVYHVGAGFESFERVHGFLTEFGMQSFPEPRTVESFTLPADRISTDTPVMNAHQKAKPNSVVLGYINRYFRAPKDFDSTLYLSQIMQAYGVEIGARSWRREMPRSTACIFWQFNDCWPVTSWSSVDSLGRWKALQYRARHFYAPILVSGTADAETGRAALSLTSDLRQKTSGTLRWRVTDAAGKGLQAGELPLEIAPNSSRVVQTLELRELLQARGVKDVLVWANFVPTGDAAKFGAANKLATRTATTNLVEAGQLTTRNSPLDSADSSTETLLLFGKPKNLALQDPRIEAQIKAVTAGQNNSYQVTLNAAHPALWSWLSLEDTDAIYSDNFVHLRPGQPLSITVTPAEPISLAQLRARLRVRSLFDLSDPNAVSGKAGDMAFGKTVTVSSTEPGEGNLAQQAVDGDSTSRWSSAYSDPQWICVDLGRIMPITRVQLRWESAFARAYRIEVSDDGQNFRTVFETENGAGQSENIALNAPTNARFVRMFGTKRATDFGFSLWDFEVY